MIFLLRAEAFSSDSNRLLSQIRAVNLNLATNVAKQLIAMINYYGGQILNEITENCTHIFATDYDSQAAHLENLDSKKFKLITPDWLIDCIEQNKLIDELPYNPKFLITNAENKDIQNKPRTVTPEPLASEQVQSASTSNQIVFKSQLILNELVLFENENNKQCTPSPTSIKLVNKSDATSINRIIIQQQQQHQSQTELIDSSNDLSKSLSASSIQAQLENTIRLNSKINMENTQQMPILIQQLPLMPTVVQTLVPIPPTSGSTVTPSSATNSNNVSLNTTPPSANKQKGKRARKQSSGISPTSGNSLQPPLASANQQSTFTSEMDEIFQSVLSSVATDDTTKIKENSKSAPPACVISNTIKDVQPIYLNLLKPSCQLDPIQFDEDTSQQEENNYSVQENSHLIQFDRCLLGCVFYIKGLFESIFIFDVFPILNYKF